MHLVFHFARLLLHQRTYVISMAIASVWEHLRLGVFAHGGVSNSWQTERAPSSMQNQQSNIEVHLYFLQFKYNSKAVDFSTYSLLCFLVTYLFHICF